MHHSAAILGSHPRLVVVIDDHTGDTMGYRH